MFMPETKLISKRLYIFRIKALSELSDVEPTDKRSHLTSSNQFETPSEMWEQRNGTNVIVALLARPSLATIAPQHYISYRV
jgi:hypothetical protein